MPKRVITGRHIIKLLAVLFLLPMIWFSCAHPGTPVGGPKDETPPKLISASPPNFSTNFNAERIELNFDEFIQLKDPGKEIFISPPVQTKPDFKLKGRSLLINFKEPLLDSTTYTIYFGKAIIDLTEGNPLSDFVYAFSTGPVIDSLEMEGQVVDAFNLQPEKEVLVMVYQNKNDTLPLDSLPLHVLPKNVTRTDDNGNFKLTNLAAGKYKLIALQDMNNNYIYDLPLEMIGFIDSLVTPSAPASLPTVSVSDSTSTDTLVETPLIKGAEKTSFEIYMFQAIDTVQRLLSSKLRNQHNIQYIFKEGVKDLQVKLLNYPDTAQWMMEEFNPGRDTLDLWLLAGLPDTLTIAVQQDSIINDTSTFIPEQAESRGLFGKKEKEVQHLKIKSNVRTTMDLNSQLRLNFSAPLKTWYPDKIEMMEDSLPVKPVFSESDKVGRNMLMDFSWKENKKYSLYFPDSTFEDIYGEFNDSTKFRIMTPTLSSYGTLEMNFKPSSDTTQYIIQLLTDKENIIHQDTLIGQRIIKYEYLSAQKLKIKAIADRNRNGQWDTGNYREQVLPEAVYYYPDEISIRANWEIQEEWDIP